MSLSWIESANKRESDFPLNNLPFCVFSTQSKPNRIGVAIGDSVLDLCQLAESNLLPFQDSLTKSVLNSLMGHSPSDNLRLRNELIGLLEDEPGKLRDNSDLQTQSIHLASDVYFHMPVAIGDYTDFFASIHHAKNVGTMFRPENPLFPNYKNLPVAYHGRASSIVVSGTTIKRPCGQMSPKPNTETPLFGPTSKLDYELELGILIGQGNQLGEPIEIENADNAIFGYCLLNDWSARDIQKWEYQPLGPFLGKSFATSISPFVVTAEAMDSFRVPASQREESDPKLFPHFDSEKNQNSGGLDLQMEVFLQSAAMREKQIEPFKVSSGCFAEMYWTVAQMIAHHTSNGCNLRPGDLLGSGTVSGKIRTQRGCLLERNWEGDQDHLVPGSQRVPLELPTGEQRDFLVDGDEVVFRAYAENDHSRIGFGECRGRIVD